MNLEIDAITFSVAQIPFSFHQSWLNLSPVVGEHRVVEDVHLVSHQTGLHAIVALIPQLSGQRVGTTVTGSPHRLTWRHPAGEMSAAFESVDTVRISGRELGVRIVAADPRLTPFSGLYFYGDPVDGSKVYTSYQTGRRYRITVLAGDLEVFGDQALGTAERGVEMTPDEGGWWEVAIEEFRTARPGYTTTRSFSQVCGAASAQFADYLQAVAPWRSVRSPAAGLAAYLLWSATVGPGGFLGRSSVLMSKHWMDKVWSWDHCFNALALAPGAPTQALDQFLAPFDHQDTSGALPDSVAHSEVLYNFVKPPIHGWALQQLRRRLPVDLDRETLAVIYTKLSAWSRFWLDRRRIPGHVLAHYQHGNDSGWDNSTVFDAGGLQETADLAGFLAQQLRVLAELAGELGRPAEQADWARHAAEVHRALLDELWDGARFAAKDPYTGELTTADSLLNTLPIVLGDTLPPDVAKSLAGQIADHLTGWGLATEPLTSPNYRPDGYWRGPIWAPATVLVEDGLRRAGYVELADDIARRFLALCEKSGFAENFDAISGDGLRDRAYTWTASAYLLLAAAQEERAELEMLNP